MEFSLGHTVDGVRSKYLADLTPDYVKLLLPKITEMAEQVRKKKRYKGLTGREAHTKIPKRKVATVC